MFLLLRVDANGAEDNLGFNGTCRFCTLSAQLIRTNSRLTLMYQVFPIASLIPVHTAPISPVTMTVITILNVYP